MKQLFISDLHLSEKEPKIEKLFHQFMQTQACIADELYVLGDLFEVWIGDDAIDAMAERVINAFSHYSKNGGKLYFMHGNRDFLLESVFTKATGGIFLQEPFRLTVGDQTALLMHGDSLCTLDEDYIAFKKLVRSTDWQQDFLSKTILQRQEIAREIRNTSKAKGVMTTDLIHDVTASEVSKVMSEANITLLIHGHTHRQDRHSLIINQQPAERIVLGDWGNTGSVLIAEDQQLTLYNFSLTD